MHLRRRKPLLVGLALSTALFAWGCSDSDNSSDGAAGGGASGFLNASGAGSSGAPAGGTAGGAPITAGAAGTGASPKAGASGAAGSAAAGAANAGAPATTAGASGTPGVSGASGTPGASGNAGTTGGGANAGAGGTANSGGSAGMAGGSMGGATTNPQSKPRVVVLTDIANEPDDEESLVRFLVYSNEFDVEALIATTSTHLKTGPREDLIRRQLTAYEQVRPNLLKHDPGFPDPAQLRSVTKTGQTGFGMAVVGAGRATGGSNLLMQVIDKVDSRPVWITVWGGANTLAQALFDLRAARPAAELTRLVANLRVYAISDQDDAGAWLRREFPNLFYIVTPSPNGASQYRLSTWSGISGDEFYSNGPGYMFTLVGNPWLTTNVRTGHGPLGALYPAWKYIMEGDTPSYLGLVDRGLGWSISPSYGGWGGRYALSKPAAEPRAIWTNSSDTFAYAAGQSATSNQATVWRWRDHYQYDFAARMDWCVADTFAKANHNPVPFLNGDGTKSVVTIPAKAGSTVALSAAGTMDPDGHAVGLKWWIYPEAGTFTGAATLSAATGQTTTVQIPAAAAAGKLHVILQAEDQGTPHLFSYRRVIVDVTP